MDSSKKDNLDETNNLIETLEAEETQTIKLFNFRLKSIKDDNTDTKYINLAALKTYATLIENKRDIAKIDEELGNVFK